MQRSSPSRTSDAPPATRRAALELLDREQANVRAAIDHALVVGEIDVAASLGSGMAWFWYVRGRFQEGREWLEKIERTGAAEDGIRAQLLNRLGILAEEQGDLEAATRALELSLELRRRNGDPPSIFATLNNLGLALTHLSRLDEAELAFRECLQIGAAGGLDTSTPYAGLGIVAFARGDLLGAAELLERAKGLSRPNDRRGLGVILVNLGSVLAALGETDRGWTCCDDALEIFEELGDPVGQALTLLNVAELLASTDSAKEALRILAASRAGLRELGFALDPFNEAQINRIDGLLREGLSPDELPMLGEIGARLDLSEAVATARSIRTTLLASTRR